jgi:hypothetical protein
MMTEKTREGANAFLMTDVSDLLANGLMKKNLKANLPGFMKMFAMIGAACGLLSKIVSISGINVAASCPASADAGARIKLHGVAGRVFGACMVHEGKRIDDSEAARTYFARLLEQIKGGCDTLIMSGNKVLGDLSADNNPLFLEVDENSIALYRNANNVAPFMPPSTMLMALSPEQPKDESSPMIPGDSSSASRFQFNFGTRKVLGQPMMPVMLDDLPGMREIADNFNKVATGDKQVNLESINAFLARYIQLVRWMSDVHVFAPLVGGDRAISRVVGLENPTGLYQFRLTLDGAMSLTTSADKGRSVTSLVSYSGPRRDLAQGRSMNRKDVQVYNLIDLNANPINVNALRREVPLVNMLNYSFTFDSFAKDMIGRYAVSSDVFDGDDSIRGGHQFLQLVLYPHIAKTADPGHWDNLMSVYADRGGDQAGLEGHDRFAYDQVCHKALMHVDRRNERMKRYEDPGRRGATSASKGRFTEANTNELMWSKAKPGRGERRLGSNVARELGSGVESANIPSANMNYIRLLGQMRHDTTFIRNILFISSVHRLMRSRMSDEMMRIAFPVVSGPPALNKRITEENSWEAW